MKLQSVYTSSMVAWVGVELGTNNNCDVWSIEWFRHGLNSASVTLDGEVSDVDLVFPSEHLALYKVLLACLAWKFSLETEQCFLG